MFKVIHALEPYYLCSDIAIIVDVQGYNTRSSENLNFYGPKNTYEICTSRFCK